MNRQNLRSAPKWAELTAPRGLLRRDVPSLLLISEPKGEGYRVATVEEADAIADPGSFVGRVLRPHCALLSLPYVGNN